MKGNKHLKIIILVILVVSMFLSGCSSTTSENNEESLPQEDKKEVTVLKYAHMSSEDSSSGRYAQFFADYVEEKSDGTIVVEIFPNSVLGSISEQAEMVSAGTVQLHHNTWGALGILLEELEALDTPYLAKSVEDYIKLNDINSPIMQSMNEKLIAASDVRVLGSIYGGSRNLTCNFPIYHPDDLKGVKIRAIPAPVYVTAVEGMGAIAVPVDWADVPTSLTTGVVEGQENPPSTIYTARLHEMQTYLMDTKHIAGIGPMVMNESSFQGLSEEQQGIILEAAAVTVEKFNQIGIDEEDEYIQKLVDEGMTFISAEDGLDVDAFKNSVDELVAINFEKYAEFYKDVNEYLGY